MVNIKYFAPLALILLVGCFDDNDDSSNGIDTPAAVNVVDIGLDSYSYAISDGEEGSGEKIITVEYEVSTDSNLEDGLEVDLYLLPDYSNETSVQYATEETEEEVELDDSEAYLIQRILHGSLEIGSHAYTSSFTIDDVTLGEGFYELVFVVDPNGIYEDRNLANNYPDHIPASEPVVSEEGEVIVDGIVYDATEFAADTSESIAIDIEDIDVPEEVMLVNVEQDPIVLTYQLDSDYLPYYDELTIPNNFSYKNEFLEFDDTESASKYYHLRLYTIYRNEYVPVKIWNKAIGSTEDSGQYCYDDVIEITDNTEHLIDYEAMIPAMDLYEDVDYPSRSWYVRVFDISEDDTLNGNEIPFIVTLTPKLITDSDECSGFKDFEDATSTEGAISQQITIPFYAIDVTPDDEPIIEAYAAESAFDPEASASADFFKFSKSFEAGDGDTAAVSLENTISLSYKPTAEDDDVLVGVFAESALNGALFGAENELLKAEASTGLTEAKKLGYEVSLYVLEGKVYSSTPAEVIDCDDPTCQQAKTFGEKWYEAMDMAKVTYPVGPIGLTIAVGAEGGINANINFGFDATLAQDVGSEETVPALYVGGDILSANLEAYLRGSLDYKLVEAGVMGAIELIDFKLNGTGYIAPWGIDGGSSIDPVAKAYAYTDLTTLSGKVGVFSAISKVKWCSKKRWGVRFKYPCGKETVTYKYWIAKLYTLYEHENKEIFSSPIFEM